MTEVLRNRAFRWIAAIFTVDAFLEWFGTIALMTLVYQHTGSTSQSAGLLICKQVAPALLVPTVAPRLDRLSVGRGLAVALLVQALSMFAIALTGYGAALFPLAVVTGTAGTLVRSTLRAGTQRALGGEQLRHGNALTNMAVAITSLAGPALAAVVVTTAGTSTSLAIAASLMLVCFIAAAVMPAGSGAADAAPAAAEAATGTEPANDRRPRGSTRSSASMALMLTLAAALFCALAMDEPTLLAYSERSLGAGVGGYGAIFATWGLGLTIGGIAFARLLHVPMLRLAIAAMALDAAAYLGLGVAPTIEVACVVAVFGGIGNGMGFVALATAIQEAAPTGSEATVAARFESIATAGPGIGIVIGGVLADITTPRLTLIVPGVLALAVLGIAALATGSRLVPLRPSLSLLPGSTSGGSA